MDNELTPEQAAPLIGATPDVLQVLIDGGADWHYFRTDLGIETRASDGTVLSFQELSPDGERIGPQRLYLRERED